VLGLVTLRVALIEYALLATTGLWLAYLMGPLFLAAAGALLFMGLVYNVKPIRLKDRPYVDILSESVNNPLRLLLGWALVVQSSLPPSSVLLAYLFGGAFLMTVKRLAEFRRIGDSATAAQYRASFGYYTENILLLSSLFYASSFAFFMGIFLIKYRIEFVLAFPFFSILFTWYLAIGLKANSVAQSPEQLYREWKLLLFIVTLVGILLTLFVVDIPPLRALLEPNLY
jgi:4-hydroxybenzoate polyprenyltransferase